MQTELKRMKLLMEFCDQMKVFFRENNQKIAEELFAHLEFKAGMMYEMSLFYFLNDELEGHPTMKRYHGEDASIAKMKILEVQNLLVTHFISTIESSLRKSLLNKGYTNKMMILNHILEDLFKEKIISKNKLHLWTGVRQIRNAIVHYEHHSHVSDTYRFSDELVIELKNGDPMTSTNIFEYLYLMEWMAYEVRNIFLK